MSDTFGYDKLSTTELRKVISDLTKQVLELKSDKREWVSAANEAIKETNSRIERAVEALRDAEKAGTDLAHERAVDVFLKSVPQSGN